MMPMELQAAAWVMQMGLGETQLLLVLAAGPLTMGQVAGALHRSTGAVTGRVDRLERKGLVQRTLGQDRRKWVVSLTDAGRAVLAQLPEAVVYPVVPSRPE